jgi:hypothetical protein
MQIFSSDIGKAVTPASVQSYHPSLFDGRGSPDARPTFSLLYTTTFHSAFRSIFGERLDHAVVPESDSVFLADRYNASNAFSVSALSSIVLCGHH